MSKLNVITYNTWKSDGDYPARLTHIAHSLERLDPDILFLQEVYRSTDGVHDTGMYLSDALQLDQIYLPGRKKIRRFQDRSVESYSGLSILTKFRTLESGYIELPTPEPDMLRHALWALIEVRKLNLLLVNTHLCHLEQADETRSQQLQQILSLVNGMKSVDFVVLGGDFNTTPTTKVIKQFNRRIQEERSDVEPAFDSTFFSTTLRRSAVDACFDYLYLISGSLPCPRFCTQRLVLQETLYNGSPLSDHLAVQGIFSTQP